MGGQNMKNTKCPYCHEELECIVLTGLAYVSVDKNGEFGEIDTDFYGADSYSCSECGEELPDGFAEQFTSKENEDDGDMGFPLVK
jgi:hypothetical protein